MAYNETAAQRIRTLLKRRRGITERKMFGGLAFLLNGHMCCGVLQDRLVLRLGDAGSAAARGKPHTAAMDFTGRPLKSMVYLEPNGFRKDSDLRRWIGAALDFARSLPGK